MLHLLLSDTGAVLTPLKQLPTWLSVLLNYQNSLVVLSTSLGYR